MSWFSFYKGIPVLNYHKVADDFEVGVTSVTRSQFTEQMHYLSKNDYQTILPKHIENHQVEKPIIISFDDAYENIYTHAFPVMETFSFVGLIFPITDFIGEMNHWDANLAGIKFKHADQSQLQELNNNGWEIGSHSKQHITVLKKQDLESEIIDSKRFLEDMFSTEVISFSYPFGRSNKVFKQCVSQNYQYAFSGQMNRRNDPYEIGRTSVYKTDSIRAFKNKLSATYMECLKLALIHKGAFATELYQKLK